MSQKFRQQTQNKQCNHAKAQNIESTSISAAIGMECNNANDNGKGADHTGNLINRSGHGSSASTAGTNNTKSFATTMAKQRRQVELFDVAGKVRCHQFTN